MRTKSIVLKGSIIKIQESSMKTSWAKDYALFIDCESEDSFHLEEWNNFYALQDECPVQIITQFFRPFRSKEICINGSLVRLSECPLYHGGTVVQLQCDSTAGSFGLDQKALFFGEVPGQITIRFLEK